MSFLVLSGMVMTAALLVTLCRVVHWKLVLGYATVVDVLATLMLLTLYAGTFSGMFAATVAGLVLAITLSFGRKVLGYTQVKWNRKFRGAAWETVQYEGVLDEINRQARRKANARSFNFEWYVERVRYTLFGPYPRQIRTPKYHAQKPFEGWGSDY